MALRDKITANAQPLIQSGEQIQAVIPCQAVNPYWSIVSYWIIIFSNAFRVIVVTDRRILVCSTKRLSATKLTGIIREAPRQTTIGPGEGLWYTTESFGEKLWINRRFFKDIATADGA